MNAEQDALVQDMKTNLDSYWFDAGYPDFVLIGKISEDGTQIWNSELNQLFSTLPKEVAGPLLDAIFFKK